MVSVIDDDQSVRESVLGLVRSLGLEACAFESAPDFLVSSSLGMTGCLIADVQMPRMTGIELYARLGELGHAIPTILVTAYLNDEVRARALADGVLCYLSKPIDDDALIRCIRSALDG
jgi:FixJ family two-component response regulator